MRPVAITICLFFIAASGCDSSPDDMPEVAPVQGVVNVDGKPVANLQVRFTPDEGKPSMATTDEEGKYVLSYSGDVAGAKIGMHTVQITTVNVSTSDRIEDQKPFKETIPAKYNKKSTLREEVKVESNTINFDLKTK